ncbi:hypothetical protein [Loigolactobacillus jiayinensis]|uniref:Uncharacterized protein n=1 Tax=Loigolactobacillus jiayinensis TaxID=2486016 RepID=A0ABW1RAM9_9LACO|nr:hypothetical protein [Loigolactobacillus jiayinensis]
MTDKIVLLERATPNDGHYLYVVGQDIYRLQELYQQRIVIPTVHVNNGKVTVIQ